MESEKNIYDIYKILIQINITEVSFYQILIHHSNNDTGNRNKHYASFDHRAKSGHIREIRNIYYSFIHFVIFSRFSCLFLRNEKTTKKNPTINKDMKPFTPDNFRKYNKKQTPNMSILQF